jgi:flavin-dependent dehydrogenase
VSADDADVVIAGGGLAGCATALALARAGHSVVCVDKAEFPRDKPCGEGL